MDTNSIYYVYTHYLMGDGNCFKESNDLRDICSWKEEYKNNYQHKELYICNQRDEVFYVFGNREIN